MIPGKKQPPEPGDNQNIPAAKRNINLRIYRSFEEAARSEAMIDARKPPLEGLRETVELILRAYGVTREQLIERRKKMHINIIKRG